MNVLVEWREKCCNEVNETTGQVCDRTEGYSDSTSTIAEADQLAAKVRDEGAWDIRITDLSSL